VHTQVCQGLAAHKRTFVNGAAVANITLCSRWQPFAKARSHQAYAYVGGLKACD
jgi:hypothetical protein